MLDEMVVRESYNVAPGLPIITKQMGIWRGGEQSWDDSTVFERRKDFNGYQFEAVTLQEYPTVIVNAENTGITIGGFFGEVWNLLENHMNFSTRIRISPDGKWGGRDENGTWNGMIQEVYEKRAQIGLGAFGLTKSRSDVVGFSPPLFQADIQIFIKYPERISSWTTFIRPFDPFLWLSLLGLLLLLSLALSITYHLGPEKIHNPGSFTFSFNLLVAFAAQMGQGSSLEPKSFSTRIVFSMIFFVAIIVIASYSAKMVAFLAIVKIQPEIENLEDIPGSDFKLGYLRGTSTSDMFEKAKVGTIYQKIYEQKVKGNPESLNDVFKDGLDKVMSEKYIFVTFAPPVIAMIKDKCDILPLPNPVSKKDNGYIWDKDLPQGQFFTYFINKMGEEGVLDKFRAKYLATPRSDCGTLDQFVSLGFVNIISAFAMLIGAYIVSILVCISECLFKHFVEKKS